MIKAGDEVTVTDHDILLLYKDKPIQKATVVGVSHDTALLDNYLYGYLDWNIRYLEKICYPEITFEHSDNPNEEFCEYSGYHYSLLQDYKGREINTYGMMYVSKHNNEASILPDNMICPHCCKSIIIRKQR